MNAMRSVMLLWYFLSQVQVMQAIRPERSVISSNGRLFSVRSKNASEAFDDKIISPDAFEQASNRACIRTILTSVCVISGSVVVMLLTNSAATGE